MNAFLNERSLHSQYASDLDVMVAAERLAALLNFIVDRNDDLLWGAARLLLYRNSTSDKMFSASLDRLNDVFLRQQLRSLLFDKGKVKDWPSVQEHNENHIFICDCLHKDDCVTWTSIAEAAHRQLNVPQEYFMLLNFSHSCFAVGKTTVLNTYTEQQVTLPCFDERSVLESWALSLLPAPPIDVWLRDTTRFRPTRHFVQGRRVYKEIATGYFWYLDNLHQNHFEVYNTQGEHGGVRKLNGIEVSNSKVEGRMIEL